MEFKYYSVKEITKFLDENGLSINKKFGQNFLINSGVCDTIVNSLSLTENDVVFEIGCGLGSLTNRLMRAPCKKVVGFEIDQAYTKHLHSLFLGNDKFTLIFGDFLKTFSEAIANHVTATDRLIITGNLPYYITTPILEKIFTSGINWDMAAFMMQKEVAERIVSSEKNKKYGSITIFCQYYSDPKIVAKISPSSFYPPPNVDSAVVRFTRKKEKIAVKSEEMFFKTAKSLFINRRKQLKNNLLHSPFITNIDQETLSMLLKKSGIAPEERGEQLPIKTIAVLADTIYDYLQESGTN